MLTAVRQSKAVLSAALLVLLVLQSGPALAICTCETAARRACCSPDPTPTTSCCSPSTEEAAASCAERVDRDRACTTTISAPRCEKETLVSELASVVPTDPGQVRLASCPFDVAPAAAVKPTPAPSTVPPHGLSLRARPLESLRLLTGSFLI